MSDKPTIIKKFNSASEFTKWAANAPCQWEGELSSRKEGRDSWAGTKTFEEAYNLALYGWDEGLEILAKQVRLANHIITKDWARQNSYDVAGGRPHIIRAIAGDPINMVVMHNDPIKPKTIVKIRTNFSYLSNVSSNKIMKWGAGICSYINALEARGYSTELEAIAESTHLNHESDNDAPNISFQFPLKRAGSPLSMSNVVFWWTHPAATRRIGFSAKERLSIEKYYGPNYGKTANVTTPEKGTLALSIDDAGENLDENLIIIRDKHMKVIDKDSALSQDLEQLEL